MKSAKRTVGAVFFRTALVFTLLSVAASGIASQASAQTGSSSEYCEVQLMGCPQNYDGQDLVVPLNVIALSTQIQACGIADSIVSSGGTPSIVFIIDESGSMGGFASNSSNFSCTPGGNGGQCEDRYGNRYKATRALLDSIYTVYPSAEVGVVIFNSTLVFDSGRDSNLVEFGGITRTNFVGPRDEGQSYIPLRPLNSASTGGGRDPFYPNDTTWIGLIKSMFVDTTVSGRAYTRIKGTTLGSGGTDISLAFEAAVEAFEASNSPKDNRYIIFFSDGEAGFGADGCDRVCQQTRSPRMQYYQDSVANTPTTYTVFLSSATRPTDPPSIVTMTNNIRTNGYSESNPNSDMWVLESNYEELLSLMMENIITPMLARSEGDARTIEIVSGSATATTEATDGSFVFGRQLPIDTTEITTVVMGINYAMRRDSIIVNHDGSFDTTTTMSDSLLSYSFTVRRSATAPANWEEAQNVRSVCGSRPRLDLQYQGQSLVGRAVTGNMGILTVAFDNSGGLFRYDEVTVQVMNADGTFTDLENFTLSGSGDIWTYDFARFVDSLAASGNGVFQHSERDSVIVFFRNPHIPLDTLRISVPYVSSRMAFYDLPGDPTTGSPRPTLLPDTITVRAGDTANIYVKFFDAYSNYLPEFERDSLITWSASEPRPTVFVGPHGVNAKFYSEVAHRAYQVNALFQQGTMALSETIVVVVVPSDPDYVDVDTTVNTALRATPNSPPKVFYFESGQRQATFYAFERDRFGNLIGPVGGATWGMDPSTNGILSVTGIGNGDSANVNRQNSAGGDILITADKSGLRQGAIQVVTVGESVVATGPNPFIPNESSVTDMIEDLRNRGLDEALYEDYRHIVNETGDRGILIAPTAPRPVREGTIRVIIYDAVGNIVFRSRPEGIAMSNNTFGFVWDGRNNNGRTVGAGTYLVRMTATQSDGSKFSSQRRIGVTVAKQ